MKSVDEVEASAYATSQRFVRHPIASSSLLYTAALLSVVQLCGKVHAEHVDLNRRHILSHDNFIVLDGQDRQRYRFLGVLPILQTVWSQAVIASVVVALATLVLILHTRTRRIRKRGGVRTHWLSYVPEPVDKLAFYLHYEASAYVAVFLEAVMSIVNVPMGIGLGLASRLSSGNLNAESGGSSAGRQRSYSDSLRMGDRGSRRGKGAGKVVHASNGGGWSSSKYASTSQRRLDAKHYPGIWNTGNSCFFNSTLQCLASVDRIRGLLEQIIVQAERSDVPTPVTDALYDVIIQLNTPTTSRTAIVPQQLTDALSKLPQTKVGSFFYAHQQQDAHELLVLITNALDDEVKAIEGERAYVEQAQTVGLRAIFAPSTDLRNALLKRSERLENPCRALIAQRTACLDCGYVEAVRHYPADELSLNVPPRSGSTTTIEACLQNWSRLEVVDWVCFRCSLLRTLERTRMDVSYLSTLANADSASSKGGGNGGGVTASAKKKSGAKRRKLREAKEREEALLTMVKEAYGEDERETRDMLDKHDIELVKAFSRAATKQVMLARTPKVLMIHLNRSNYSAGNFGASKNNAAILFDEELDLAEIVTAGDLSVRGDRPISRGVTPMDLYDDNSDQRSWTTQQNGRKNGTQAEKANGDRVVPVEMDLLGNKSGAAMKTCYRLCGIVVHYGGHSSGHYVAFRRRSRATQVQSRKSNGVRIKDDIDEDDDDDDDESEEEERRANRVYEALSAAYVNDPAAMQTDDWYRISDDSVSRCSWHDVARQNPFLLFYERIGDTDEQAAGSTIAAHVNGNGTDKAADVHVPQGFASFADVLKPTIGPRVVQRWEALPFDERRLTTSKSVPVLTSSTEADRTNGQNGLDSNHTDECDNGERTSS